MTKPPSETERPHPCGAPVLVPGTVQLSPYVGQVTPPCPTHLFLPCIALEHLPHGAEGPRSVLLPKMPLVWKFF